MSCFWLADFLVLQKGYTYSWGYISKYWILQKVFSQITNKILFSSHKMPSLFGHVVTSGQLNHKVLFGKDEMTTRTLRECSKIILLYFRPSWTHTPSISYHSNILIDPPHSRKQEYASWLNLHHILACFVAFLIWKIHI